MSDKYFRPPSLVLATIGISLTTFMQVLDTTIANVALPTIAGNLGVCSEQGTWVITSFAVSNAISLPLTGWIARRIGHTKLFLVSLLLFIITSFLCGIAQKLIQLVFYRALQGFFAGPLYPISQTLLLSIYPIDKRGMALSLLAMVTVVAPIIGPLAGGFITDNYSWSWIFFINIPTGILAIIIVFTQLKNRPDETEQKPIDYIGLFLLVLGVSLLQIVLDKGNNLDWFQSNFINIAMLIAVISLTFLVLWELTYKYPIINFRLFKYHNFSVGALNIVLGYSGFFSINLILPQWLQHQLGYTPLWAGLAAAPIGILPMVINPLVGRYGLKLDLRLLASFSFLVMGISCYMRSNFTTMVNYEHIAIIQCFMGIGIALFFMPLNQILLSSLPEKDITDGASLATFIRVLGSSFAASITSWFWQWRNIFHHAQLTENITSDNKTIKLFLDHLSGSEQMKIAQLANIIEQQSAMLSTIDYFTILGWMFFFLSIFIFYSKPPFTYTGKA
ncbi:drug resistance transporter, EmrB/QacA subfamily [Candidatus Palibaumannia cicadellinicola]|uniref:Drug resistance transporter, EmrB/QacA subfamily n=2 Tax=Candidatus Palibaumannia cicadellinicola TaxID=186490 RepID=A0A0K2BKY9_9GAMM|nr:DHA2 family efflux MFS transporter permease subunit [Candidatus Baumannia cicadellinicola]AKZ65995.1 drug resistance transporter, EmrB/QacA subfamily [Candidatus Baumannia cicadellinicola]